MPFTIDLFSLSARSGIADLFAGDETCRLHLSALSDGLGDLVRSTVALWEAPPGTTVRCMWQDEPGEDRWVFQRTGNETLHLEIREFKDTFSRLTDEKGVCLFQVDTTILRLATQVKGQLHRWLNEYGEEGYAKEWGYPFPGDSFMRLEALIRKWKTL